MPISHHEYAMMLQEGRTTKMPEKHQLISEINANEPLREAARRSEDWHSYQAICMELMNLGRRLDLLEVQEQREKEGVIL